MNSIQQLSGINLRYAMDVDADLAKSVAASMNCKWTTNFEDTLADPKVDAVIVASPTDAHFE